MSRLDAKARGQLAALVAATRWAALATVDADGSPLASQVAVAFTAGVAILHLSTLAAHTRNLLARPQCALSVSEADDGRADPQTLARLSLQARAARVDRESSSYAALRRSYLQRFAAAEPRFEFGDFHLFRLDLAGGLLVGGFAAAYKLTADDLVQSS